MKNLSREKIYGIAGTVLFHLLLCVLLYFIVMERIPVQPEKSNIQMQSAAEGDAGEEFFEPAKMPEVDPLMTPAKSSADVVPPKEPLIVQNDEVSLPVDTFNATKPVIPEESQLAKDDEKRRAEEERRALEEAERKAKEEAERKAKELIAKSVAGTFGKSNKISSTSGGAAGEGSAGKVAGGDSKGVIKGSGAGVGLEYSVGNRTQVGEIDWNIPVQEEGTVVVDVVVDPQGRVISANAKTTSIKLKEASEKVAKKIRFNQVADIKGNEVGKITFKFKMNY